MANKLYRRRRQRAVKSVLYDGKAIAPDSNMQTLLGVLRLVRGLETTGSCGGHARRGYGDCQAKRGTFFVSFRVDRPQAVALMEFAQTVRGVVFMTGERGKLPACPGGVCKSEGEAPWYAFKGTANPERVAGALHRYLLQSKIGLTIEGELDREIEFVRLAA